MAKKLNKSQRFHAAFGAESQRGQVLIAHAAIDNAMEGILRTEFARRAGKRNRKVKKYSDALLSNRPIPPLGSSYARAALLYVLGVFDDRFLRALDALRKMRNDAAHIDEAFSIDAYDLKPITDVLTVDEMSGIEKFYGATDNDSLFRGAMSHIILRLLHLVVEPERSTDILKTRNIFRRLSKTERNRRHRKSRSGSSDSAASDAKT
jgi:DNA-binding MltR family transcriptional regulator